MCQLPLGHLIERAPSTNWPSSFLKSESVIPKREPGKFMYKLSLGHLIERTPCTNWPCSFWKVTVEMEWNGTYLDRGGHGPECIEKY